MTREQVITHLCKTVRIVYHAIGDYSESSDCFCVEKPPELFRHFRHSGKTLRYVREAVLEKLERDGYKNKTDLRYLDEEAGEIE